MFGPLRRSHDGGATRNEEAYMLNARALVLLPMMTAAGLTACTSTPDDPPVEMCAATLPQAMNRCTAAGCTSTTDPKVHQEAVLTPGKWIVISSVTSELNDNEN